MTYIIFKTGKEVNRIVADEAFCQRYYSQDGYSYEQAPPRPEPEPAAPPPTVEELQAELAATQKRLDAAIQSNAILEDCVVEMAGVVYA